MEISHKNITSLLEFVKIDRFYVVCHFRCKITNKIVISTVPFEPYEGEIEISWQDMLFRPIESYNRYYHTPITIYNHDCQDTVVLKAFLKVSKYFEWNERFGTYVYRTNKGLNLEQKAS